MNNTIHGFYVVWHYVYIHRNDDSKFTITEIGLNRKRVFIITLNIIKLQKYYTLNIPYCGASPRIPNLK